MVNLEELRKEILKREDILSPYATKDIDAIRFKEEKKDIRLQFQRDVDRIIHTLTYTRYMDKTQVYTNAFNDNISRRMTHVQFVSKTSRTIARALKLNEDLCEAIALGHDLGHTPFGHEGEAILNEISKEKLGIIFAHNLNSVRVFTSIEKDGKGCNLCLQTLDGIMCHNGEMPIDKYSPVSKLKEEFVNEYNSCLDGSMDINKLRPMTLEGCIVRISDIIGYIGKDLEDAIYLRKINIEDIPKDILDVLGASNDKIMDNIIMDIIQNSYDKPYIKLSNKVYNALVKLKKFNMENIYLKANTKENIENYKSMFYSLYDVYITALKSNDITNDIYVLFLDKMCKEYIQNTKQEQIVIDYISGMTDNFIQKQYQKYVLKEER